MKKRVFSLMAVVMFSTSLLSATSDVVDLEFVDCWELADIGTNNANCTFEELTGHEMSHLQWYNMWSNLYDHCMSKQ